MEQTGKEELQSAVGEIALDKAACRKDFSRVGLCFLLGAVLINGLQYAVLLLCGKFMPEIMKNGNAALILQMAPTYLIGMPLLIFFLYKLPGVEPVKHQMKWWQFLAAMPMSYTIMIVSNVVGLIITGIIGLIKGAEVNNVMVDVVTSISLWVRILVMVICAPIFEELIFRKMLVSRTLKYGQGVAIVLSGLMFGLFHGNLNQFAYACCLGMFFAFLYAKTGNIKITIGLHMFINFIGGVFGGWLLELLDYEELAELTVNGAGQAEMMSFMMEHLFGFFLYGVFLLLIIVMLVTGIVLFIVFRKKFTLAQGQVQLPKGQRFSIVILNIGMLLYCLFWMVSIVLQLIM
ncbi:MAG: CPBP family intramembrane metalloprotease [Roseburia sp.]|nr:CPBP family intramembrane metalloprotease [Roseburia sp.]